jgi:alginate O-acetyltransferase complex protein AlgI
VALDLGILGLFKYYGFFATDVARVLDAVGLGLPLPLLNLALPVGLSFFTFQAISYVVDVHRGICERAPTLDVAVYLWFFPHLVAGPIVRAREFLPQIARPRDREDVAVGAAVVLIALGLVKKVVIADFLARHAVDPVFAVPEAYGAPDAWLAMYAYAAQIYCDFSGYTDIAIGLALLMGIVFPRNFHRPYAATSFREFWRRWHMTLSRYLRDFLYIPLGGNRGGRLRTARNLMLTMVLGGLWHGAAWGFVLWGALHGAFLAGERLLRGRVRIPRWLAWALVLQLVVLAWIPFRAPDLHLAGTFASRLVAPGPATLWAPGVVVALAAVFGLQLLPERPLDALRARVETLSPVALGTALAFVVAVVAATVPANAVPPFIYFQF